MKKNKFIIVTGGLGFIGSYFSSFLINKKFKVIILDNNTPSSNLQKALVKNCYMYLKLDITNETEIKNLFKKLKSKKVKVEYLINNAAVDSVPRRSEKQSHLPNLDNWNNELAVSLTGSYLLIKYFGEVMAKRKFGKIINIGSDLSVIAPNQELYSDFKNFLKPVTYSVIKHGMLGMTKYFASLYAKRNVQVNMLSPGPVYNGQKKNFVKKLLKFIPSKKMASRQDIIEPLFFLLDERNKYITGQNILVDGGRTII
jgi:NAD(P)-dependent dehydrogenase (short-subunit alcohol dehydrogenase family)